MERSAQWFVCSALVLALLDAPLAMADSDRGCRLQGNYGYLYNGKSFPASGSLDLTETGSFSIGEGGELIGVGTLAFQFSNFGGAPLWLLLREVQSNGVITPDADNPCTGNIAFIASATVIKTSNAAVVPVGTVLFANSPRSIAYTISGRKHEIVDLISTSPGTIASGTAHKQ